MNLDKYGLPCNINPDGSTDSNDSLNRVGLLYLTYPWWSKDPWFRIIFKNLRHERGIYKRYTEGDPRNVSADQLIPLACAFCRYGWFDHLGDMEKAMWKRWGFAQNVVDGLNGDNEKRKIPDLMFLRAMPIFSRWRFDRWVWDWFLLVMLVSDYFYSKGKDNVDVNCTLATFYVCKRVRPTPMSRFVWWAWLKLRDVPAALRRYHRAESGGNPEIAEMLIKAML